MHTSQAMGSVHLILQNFFLYEQKCRLYFVINPYFLSWSAYVLTFLGISCSYVISCKSLFIKMLIHFLFLQFTFWYVTPKIWLPSVLFHSFKVLTFCAMVKKSVLFFVLWIIMYAHFYPLFFSAMIFPFFHSAVVPGPSFAILSSAYFCRNVI